VNAHIAKLCYSSVGTYSSLSVDFRAGSVLGNGFPPSAASCGSTEEAAGMINEKRKKHSSEVF
jgi:hypothetical protein